MLWSRWIRPVLFCGDAEKTHYRAMAALTAAAKVPGVLEQIRALAKVQDDRLAVEVLGHRFPNPIGLAAGFDKDGRWHHLLSALGFGFIEVGTITDLPQDGNPKPRLFRLPMDQALLNRLGFNNAGAEVARRRLERQPPNVVLGINIGKSKMTPNELATNSYLKSFKLLWPFAHYVTINVSSPNTPGLRALQDRQPLLALLQAIAAANHDLAREHSRPPKPVLVKIAPDLNDAQVEDVVEIALEAKLAGIIATNTTIRRDGLKTPAAEVAKLGDGGISGRPVHARSCEVVRRLYRRSAGQLTIMGVGGVFDGDDAWRMLGAGASLVQVYTGFIYGGPLMVAAINRQLLAKLGLYGMTHLSQRIGQEA
jgi:dihydroorotate dehydrogenase